MELVDRLRMAQTKRYPICHTSRDQSVAEHSFGVLLITMELVKTLPDRSIAEEATRYAILHDAEEVYTGDIPSSFKRVLRARAPSVSALMDGPNPDVSDEAKAIVKLADYLEAIYYLREFGGSRLTVNVVLVDILDNFRKSIGTTLAPTECILRAIDLEKRL